MADAVINSTGEIFFSKLVDTGVTLTNNVLDSTNAVDDTTPANGKWTSMDVTGATAADKVVLSTHTTVASESGPASGLTIVKMAVGSASTPIAGASGIAYGRFASANISSYDAISFYIRVGMASPTAGTTVSTLQFVTCSDAAGATAVETLNLPAIPVTDMTLATDVVAGTGDTTPPDINKWRRVIVKLNSPSSNNALLSVALKTSAAISAACNIYIYQVRLLKSFPGRTGFSISETVDTVDVSDYQSLRTKEFSDTFSSWTATIDGHKEGAPPLEKNKKYALGFWEADTVGQAFIGDAFYTGFTPSGTFNDSVKYSYSNALLVPYISNVR